MVEHGAVVPGILTDWAAVVVIADKEDGTRRLCVNYRPFYAMTIRNAYQIHRIYECIDSLLNPEVFSSLMRARILEGAERIEGQL